MKKEEKKKRMTGFEFLVLAALILLIVWIGIRFYIVWNYDWSNFSIESITLKEWIVTALAIGGIIALTKWK